MNASDDFGLRAISPLDGRYGNKLAGLGDYVSEAALIKYRLVVEVQWLLHLSEQPSLKDVLSLTPPVRTVLARILDGTLDDAPAAVKRIEATTNHDVKAVEYYLRERLQAAGASSQVLAFIHFACTSEDINNLAYALMLKGVRDKRLVPLWTSLIDDLNSKIKAYGDWPMLSRTHGQTATPTTLGKELAVFAQRLWRQQQQLSRLCLQGKINGAVGNYNAHVAALPALDWVTICRDFVEKRLHLEFNPLTTQIENHDTVVEYAHQLKQFNSIALGLCRDIWGYISLGYFRQQKRDGEVGSSTMPHKVNPIDFENAEGNFGIANALATHFADKLPISRFQRDLSDSTVLRSLGSLIGYTELACKSLRQGLGKISAERERIAADLDQAWEVLAEPVQTVMRCHGIVDAYERLKAATRGQAVTREQLSVVIAGCSELPAAVKEQLKNLTPAQYTGLAAQLASEFVKQWEGRSS